MKEGSEEDGSKGRRIAKMMIHTRAKRDENFMKEGLIFSMKYYRDIRTERGKN